MAKMLLMENEKILQNDNSNENGSNLSNEENPTGTKDTSISIYKEFLISNQNTFLFTSLESRLST